MIIQPRSTRHGAWHWLSFQRDTLKARRQRPAIRMSGEVQKRSTGLAPGDLSVKHRPVANARCRSTLTKLAPEGEFSISFVH